MDGDDEDEDEAIAEHLRLEALDSLGHLRRQIADRIKFPTVQDTTMELSTRLLKGHRLSVTSIALTHDECSIYSVSKDGAVVLHDVETGKRCTIWSRRSLATSVPAQPATTTGADWVKPAARQGSSNSLLSVAVSFDGRYLAAGGGDKLVHVWDARNRQHLRAFPGHKDAVTSLAFREGTHQLYSGSLDRSIKIWSLEDMAYVDTLFGHQAEVLGLDALRSERIVSCGADRTCRVWKIPEESQLVFRGYCPTIESVAYLTGSEWVSGSADGSLQLWNATKKKPISAIPDAHRTTVDIGVSAGAVDGMATSWVSSVAVCRGTDLVASGAGNGTLCLWKVSDEGGGGGRQGKTLQPIGGIPVRGFINSIQIARSGRFLAAGVGQEPRMGRWLRDKVARNGVIVCPLPLEPET